MLLFILALEYTIPIFEMSLWKYVICLNMKATKLAQVLNYFGLCLVELRVSKTSLNISISICKVIIVIQGRVERVLLSNKFLIKSHRCLLLT